MHRSAVILFFLFLSGIAGAQSKFKARFPLHGVSVQFAGSVGFLSAGYHVRNKNEKMEIGMVYGYTPELFGGELHSLSLKVTYIPFHIRFLKHFTWEPLQAGVFVAQNFGKNLYLTWPEKYTRHYYWWSPSLREHVFLSSGVSVNLEYKHLDKIRYYFEANTNDLYIYSFVPNRGALSLYDITYFGMGLKADFR